MKKGDKTELLFGRGQKPLVLKKMRFVVVKGRDEGREMVLQKAQAAVGTLAGNDLVLTDPTVSRRHALVEERADGYLLRDLDSTNGTFLDNVRVREGYISPGSVIRLGETEISFTSLQERVENLKSSSDRFGGLIGGAASMQEVFGVLERVAPTHLTFAIAAEDYDAWEKWLSKNGLAIELKKNWELGGRSLYFRDPDGHLLELATPGVWKIY